MRGPHDVRRAVLDGPARLADRRDRRPAHRLAPTSRSRMRIMTRMGAGALERLGEDGDFVPCLHSVGAPLDDGEDDVPWPCNDEKYIVHFPETREIWSYGSGYGGNALLGKKCFALRIASVMARDEGWLAEHMLILKLTSPEGESKYVTGAFPSRLRQDQPGDADPDARGLEGRDDRRRHRLDEVRRRRPPVRDQPRGRLLRRRARARARRPTRTRWRRSSTNTIFTNCALTDDGDVWWEGMTEEPPAHAIDWHGNDWTPDVRRARRPPERALHHAGRAGPGDRARVGGPEGRADRRDPVRRPPRDGRAAGARGVRLGARRLPRRRRCARRRPRPRPATVGELRRDPFAMLPFCGYHMADYFAALAEDRRARGREAAEDLLRQLVPQGRRRASSCGPASARTRACWSGSSAAATAPPRRVETPIGRVPTPDSLNTEGLDIPDDAARGDPRRRRRAVEGARSRRSASSSREFGDRLPARDPQRSSTRWRSA